MNNSNDFWKILSERLRLIRLENDFSNEYVANYLEIHRETYRKYEKNPKNMSIDLLCKLLDLYQINLLIFLNEIMAKCH